MKNTLQVTENAAISMSSLEIVQFINSRRPEGSAELRHYDFLEKVIKVLGLEYAGNFRSTYVADNGKENPCYRFPKRESMLMAMSYDYAAQAAIYDRWQELETQLHQLESEKVKDLERRNLQLIHDLSDNISHIASSMNAIKAAENEVKAMKARMSDYIADRVVDLRELSMEMRVANQVGFSEDLVAVVTAMLKDLKGIANPKNEELQSWSMVSKQGLDRYAQERVAALLRQAKIQISNRNK